MTVYVEEATLLNDNFTSNGLLDIPSEAGTHIYP